MKQIENLYCTIDMRDLRALEGKEVLVIGENPGGIIVHGYIKSFPGNELALEKGFSIGGSVRLSDGTEGARKFIDICRSYKSKEDLFVKVDFSRDWVAYYF